MPSDTGDLTLILILGVIVGIVFCLSVMIGMGGCGEYVYACARAAGGME